MSFIRKGLLALVAALTLTAGIAAVVTVADTVTAAPAAAGEGYWSVSTCSGPVYASRTDIWWLGTTGSGAFYWHRNLGSGAPWAGQAFYVSGRIHLSFAAGGYECGAAGAPTSEVHNCPVQYGNNIIQSQRFEQGRYIVRANGDTWYQHGVINSSCSEA